MERKTLMRALVLALALMVSAGAMAQTRKHEVQGGETLYSISRTYGVSIDAIRQANPNMGETILAGQTLVIPAAGAQGTAQPATPVTTTQPVKQQQQPVQQQPVRTVRAEDVERAVKAQQQAPQPTPECKQMYLVEKKETVYSISHKFGLTEDELRAANPQITKNKVKKGEYLCIPYSAAEKAAIQQRKQEEQAAQRRREEEARQKAAAEAKKVRQQQAINVAVILPFDLDSKNKGKEATKMLDFYQGFLLAVDELKGKGVSTNVYAYEEKGVYSSALDTILEKPAMAHMNLIVGPMRVEHIPALSRFARKHNIPLAVPFSTKASITASQPCVFQVNTAAASLYGRVYQQFTERYQGANVIFVNCNDNSDKADYIINFKNALQTKGTGFQMIDAANIVNDLKPLLSSEKKNVLVLSSPSQSAFGNVVRKLNAVSELSAYQVSLFGFPEWQTFSDKNKQNLRKYHASFFTTFYTNPNAGDTQNFNQKFRSWFKRNQFSSVPLYGLLGYDVGKYFLTGIYEHGSNFMQNAPSMRVPALQNPMQFERAAAGNGFVNCAIRIISM